MRASPDLGWALVQYHDGGERPSVREKAKVVVEDAASLEEGRGEADLLLHEILPSPQLAVIVPHAASHDANVSSSAVLALNRMDAPSPRVGNLGEQVVLAKGIHGHERRAVLKADAHESLPVLEGQVVYAGMSIQRLMERQLSLVQLMNS